MNRIDKNNAGEWVEKFLEGQTTTNEEQELYSFFANGPVPRHLKKYRPMFAWYAGGMAGEPPRPKKVVMHRWQPVAVAASVLLAFAVSAGLWMKNTPYKYESLEGSYIVRNGHKITDIERILPELKQTYRQALQEEQEVYQSTRFNVDCYMLLLENGAPEEEETNIPVI